MTPRKVLNVKIMHSFTHTHISNIHVLSQMASNNQNSIERNIALNGYQLLSLSELHFLYAQVLRKHTIKVP